MKQRPVISIQLDAETFRSYYYLKEELIDFCRSNGLSVSGGKIDITNRIAHYLATGTIQSSSAAKKKSITIEQIDEDTLIESDFVCSEKHRAFFKEKIGSGFSFNVVFQKWLKSNAGKTYSDAITAYQQISEDKKKSKTTIDKQFEYNTYIRAFFKDNEGKTLSHAILCWKYKKSIQGHNRYERSDLAALL